MRQSCCCDTLVSISVPLSRGCGSLYCLFYCGSTALVSPATMTFATFSCALHTDRAYLLSENPFRSGISFRPPSGPQSLFVPDRYSNGAAFFCSSQQPSFARAGFDRRFYSYCTYMSTPEEHTDVCWRTSDNSASVEVLSTIGTSCCPKFSYPVQRSRATRF